MKGNPFVTAAKLIEVRDTMRRVLGTQWERTATPFRLALEEHMRRTGETNHMKAVLPIAEAMRKAGDDPTMLIAVAVDMADGGAA